MGDLGKAAIGLVGGFILLAIWSVALSRNSQGPAMVQAIGSALANVIGAAVSPTTGAQVAVNTGGNSGFNSASGLDLYSLENQIFSPG